MAAGALTPARGTPVTGGWPHPYFAWQHPRRRLRLVRG
jgi:hypothetical protein